MTEIVEVVEIKESMPFKHQLAKLLIATVVAFAATKLTEKAYDSSLQAYQNRQITPPTEV